MTSDLMDRIRTSVRDLFLQRLLKASPMRYARATPVSDRGRATSLPMKQLPNPHLPGTRILIHLRGYPAGFMEEEDPREAETAQTLFFLGMRKAAVYELGCSRMVKILRLPLAQTPAYTDSFHDFLTRSPADRQRGLQIGAQSLTNNGLCYEHLNCRNRFCMKGNYLFEGYGASLRIVEDPTNEENWASVSPAISTRSVCTSISLNPQISFGVATTKKSPVVFGLTHNPVTRFVRAEFLSFDAPVCDGAPNNMMEGESIFATNEGGVFLYDRERLVSRIGEIFDEEFDETAVSFGFHPRVVAASCREYVRIYDCRLKDPCGACIECNIERVSSILTVDSNQITVASMNGLYMIDMRFPSQVASYFEYFFTGPPMSLAKRPLGDFTCIVAQCPRSSEVVFFPFSRYEYVAPLRPFDAVVQEYTTEEQEYLTGLAAPEDLAFLQFERGGVVLLELRDDLPPCKHYFATLSREEKEVPKDVFKFEPQFETLRTNDDKPSPNWELMFHDLTEPPPSSMLYDPPDVEEAEDPGTPGYLIEVKDAMEDLGEEDVPTALGLFWKNHLSIARSSMS